MLLAADAPEPITEPYIEETAADRVSVARQVGGGIVLALIIGGMGLFHVVRTESGATLVPKEHLTYSMTFTSVTEVLERWNNRSIGDALRGDKLLEHLVRELERRGYITSRQGLTAASGETNVPQTPAAGAASWSPDPDLAQYPQAAADAIRLIPDDDLAQYRGYPNHLLDKSPFVVAFEAIRPMLPKREWIPSLGETQSLNSLAKYSGGRLILAGGCRAHFCTSDEVRVAFNPETNECVVLVMIDKRRKWYGSPNPEVRRILDASVDS